MSLPITLASGSQIRRTLLANAGLTFATSPVDVDEDAIKKRCLSNGFSPPQIAAVLAKCKAAACPSDGYVIGADQVLDHQNAILSKPTSKDAARQQLMALRGTRHRLHSALAVFKSGTCVFEDIATVTLFMRNFSDEFLEGYLARNWPGIQSSVGSYKLEEEGSRLFQEIDGDYFAVLGLPLLPLFNFLVEDGAFPG